MASIRKRIWEWKGEQRESWVVDYLDQHGKRRLKTFKTRKAADKWSRGALHEVDQGTHTPDSDSKTIREAADAWIEGRRLNERERSTLDQYRNHVDRYIVPRIGSTKLSRLTTPAVERFKEDLLGACSRPMARKVLQSLRSLLSDAQRRGYVAQNVARGVTIDTSKRGEGKVTAGRDFPTKEEVRGLLNEASGRWRPLIVTAIFTGMRASELRGLMWADVDFERNVIRVHQRADQWGQIGDPKSGGSHREIPMTPMVANTLKEWRLACPRIKKRKDDPGVLRFAFPNGRGNVETLQNILKRGFGPLQLAAGVSEPVLDDQGQPKLDEKGKPIRRPKYAMHALRHFYASWIIDQGFPPKKAQALLGHASIQLTFDTYGHLFPSLEDDHAKLKAGELALVSDRDKAATTAA